MTIFRMACSGAGVAFRSTCAVIIVQGDFRSYTSRGSESVRKQSRAVDCPLSVLCTVYKSVQNIKIDCAGGDYTASLVINCEDAGSDVW